MSTTLYWITVGIIKIWCEKITISIDFAYILWYIMLRWKDIVHQKRDAQTRFRMDIIFCEFATGQILYSIWNCTIVRIRYAIGILSLNQIFRKEDTEHMRNQHVTPCKGKSQVKGEGASKATKVFGRQSDAIEFGRDIAINQHSELFIHGRNGQIRDRDSYGNDPCPPRDMVH